MRTCADSYEDPAYGQHVEAEMARARGERALWELEIDRIGAEYAAGRIDGDAARSLLLANGGTGREAGYQVALWNLTAKSGIPDLTARNLLFEAFKGQSAWFGGSQSPNRLVYSEHDGYQVLADGYVIREG